MTENNTITRPTIAQLISGLKEFHGLEIDASAITEEIYTNATKGYARGMSLKSMANMARFYLVGANKKEAPKESISVTGVFVGSRDIATQKKPLGKNKSQFISFLQQGEDGFMRVFSNPNTPTHFKGFKKQNFGALIEADFGISTSGAGTYVTPENVVVIEKAYELDTSKIKVYEAKDLPELEDYTPCAMVGKISSIKTLRAPPWEQDNYEDEDFPLVINKNPVFTVYMQGEEDGPVIKGMVNPTHISKPYIALEDFESIWPLEEDLGAVDEDFLEEFVTPMYNDMPVILVGQKKRSSGDETVYVDFDITAIIPVNGDPSIIEVESGVKRAKAAKNASNAKNDVKDDAAADKARNNKRMELVDEVVQSMLDATTPSIVREMTEKKYFLGVEDPEIQKMIEKVFYEQGITVSDSEEHASTEEPESDEVWE